VDDLEKCSGMVGKDQKEILASKFRSNVSSMPPARKMSAEPRKYFPFKQGYLAVAILRVGAHGIHMTVDGKHITSFAFREVSLAQVIHHAFCPIAIYSQNDFQFMLKYFLSHKHRYETILIAYALL